MTDKSLERSLPTSVQKSYFMLSDAERAILNTALGKYQPEGVGAYLEMDDGHISRQ